MKIEKNKKAGSHWELNPGHFWLEQPCSATTTTGRAAGSSLQMVGGEDVEIKLAREVHSKILDLVIFSSQEALSLHFSFKLGVTII